MTELGYTLSCEEHAPADLVRYARRAEEVGFSFTSISDHFHPWVDRQGNSPFVWAVIGGVAAATERLPLITAVTCPIIRIHPAVIAHAAATAAAMMPGRFSFGVGTGENLNEHVVGEGWPPAHERLEMLEEAIEVIRTLWQGGPVNLETPHYTVENARLYTLPDEPPPILVAAKGPEAASLAGRVGDGLVGTSPNEEVFQAFDAAGGAGKPRYGQVQVCWAESEEEARRVAHEWWPNGPVPGELSVELPLPRHFEQASSLVSEEEVAQMVVCGPDPERHLEAIGQYAAGGYTHVFVHQVGPDQEGFFRFYEREIVPKFA